MYTLACQISLVRCSVALTGCACASQELCFCLELRELHLGQNQLVIMKGPIWQWQHLVVVDLSDNDLLFVPNDLGRLNLKSINISGNPKIRLPDAVGT